MARPKKEEYGYIPSRGEYRKRLRNKEGKIVSLYAKTPSELEDKIIAFRAEESQRTEDAGNPLVTQAIQAWCDLCLKDVSKETRKDYQVIVDNHIKPHVEGLHMSDVYPNTIDEIMSHVVTKSESVHNKTYMLLKRFFTFAFENGDIPTNPCPEMHNGGVISEEKNALTREQIQMLRESLCGTSAYLFCMIALYSGLRTEEILGLQWDCVKLRKPACIEVKRACRWDHNKPIIEERLKSSAARRIVPIPAVLVYLLRDEKHQTVSKFVICNRDGGPLSKSQFRKLWANVDRRKVKDRTYYRLVNGEKEFHTVHAEMGCMAKRGKFVYCIDFPISPHILRHTYITNLLLAGMDIKTVQYLAGHEKSKTTLDIYNHLVYNRPEELLAKVQTAFDSSDATTSPHLPTS